MVSFGVQMSPRQALNFEIFNFHEYLWCSSAKRENLEEEKCVLSGLIVRKIKKLKIVEFRWKWTARHVISSLGDKLRTWIDIANKMQIWCARLTTQFKQQVSTQIDRFNPQWKNQKNLRLQWAKLDRLFVAIRRTLKLPKFKSV